MPGSSVETPFVTRYYSCGNHRGEPAHRQFLAALPALFRYTSIGHHVWLQLGDDEEAVVFRTWLGGDIDSHGNLPLGYVLVNCFIDP